MVIFPSVVNYTEKEEQIEETGKLYVLVAPLVLILCTSMKVAILSGYKLTRSIFVLLNFSSIKEIMIDNMHDAIFQFFVKITLV